MNSASLDILEMTLKPYCFRWLAPETLKFGTYSNKSDVWSCGVLMFEVFTDGQIPYKEVLALRDVRKKVIEGLRLVPPPDMPAEDAAVMLLCFETDPAQRVSFAKLKASYKSVNTSGLIAKVLDFFKPEKANVTAVKT